MRTARIASNRRALTRVRERRRDYGFALPGPLYCDTSALVKLYVKERGSDEFNALVAGRDDVLVSELTVTEIVSALARRSRQGTVPGEVVGRVQHVVVGRLDDGTYRRVELTAAIHRRAEHFLLNLTDIPLRAADALHLALATSAQAASLASFDTRLATAARAIGLATYPS